LLRAPTMTSSCPDCGTSMEFDEREVHLRTGTCPSCSKEYAFVEGSTVSARLARAPAGGTEPSEVVAVVGEGGPECDECGAPLSFKEGKNGSLEAVCADCEITTIFVPQRGAPKLEREREAPKFERERPERFDAEAPRSRPCRKCGAPLRFSTGDDGMLVGECESCGNRFTLPPRSDSGGGRSDRGGPRYGRREFRPSSGGRPPYRGRGGYGAGRPSGGYARRGPPRSDDDDDRRKRRRRED